jgi:hypothetical protein
MTVSTATRTAGPYSGDGSTVAFSFVFKVFAATDLLVKTTTGSTVTGLTIGSDYSVSLNTDQDSNPGGTITLTTPLATDSTLMITSAVPATQGVSILNLGGFYPKIIEAAFDKLTILYQQLTAGIGTISDLIIETLSIGTILPVSGSLTVAGTVFNTIQLTETNMNSITAPGSYMLPSSGVTNGPWIGSNSFQLQVFRGGFSSTITQYLHGYGSSSDIFCHRGGQLVSGSWVWQPWQVQAGGRGVLVWSGNSTSVAMSSLTCGDIDGRYVIITATGFYGLPIDVISNLSVSMFGAVVGSVGYYATCNGAHVFNAFTSTGASAYIVAIYRTC